MLSKRRALARLREQLGTIPQLKEGERFSREFVRWRSETSAVIELVYGSDVDYVGDFDEIEYELKPSSSFTPDFEYDNMFRRGLDIAAEWLNWCIKHIDAEWEDDPEPPSATPLSARDELTPYIDPHRLQALRGVHHPKYDLSRLIRLAEEIHLCYRIGAVHAVAATTRALMDHVPPIFGYRTFAEVANNYAGTKSFKASMTRLEQTARPVGDAHLHTTIRPCEALPTRTQVNFSSEIDTLLAEVTRILEQQK